MIRGAEPALGTEPPALVGRLARWAEVERVNDHSMAAGVEPCPGGELADRERRGPFVLDVLGAVVAVGGRRPERDVERDAVVEERVVGEQPESLKRRRRVFLAQPLEAADRRLSLTEERLELELLVLGPASTCFEVLDPLRQAIAAKL